MSQKTSELGFLGLKSRGKLKLKKTGKEDQGRPVPVPGLFGKGVGWQYEKGDESLKKSRRVLKGGTRNHLGGGGGQPPPWFGSLWLIIWGGRAICRDLQAIDKGFARFGQSLL